MSQAMDEELFDSEFFRLTSPEPEKWAAEIRDVLKVAEAKYGPRNHQYRLNSLVYAGGNKLGIGTGVIGGVPKNEAVIYLQRRTCRHDPVMRAGSLAHECIHFMYPIEEERITYLEEGIAEEFAFEYVRERFNHEWDSRPRRSYRAARRLVQRLLLLCPNAIFEARKWEPSFSRINSELLLKVCPRCPSELAEQLTRRFRKRGRASAP